MRLLEDGQIIRDTYEVERFLGEGAFAEVYRVRHRFLGRQAMKVFKRVGMSLDEINDMLGEAILLSRIGQPEHRPRLRRQRDRVQARCLRLLHDGECSRWQLGEVLALARRASRAH